MERSKKSPTHNLWRIRTDANGTTRWQNVGAAWVNIDGSVNVILRDAVPENARLQLRTRENRASKPGGDSRPDDVKARDQVSEWANKN